MKAFHGKASIKKKYLARVRAHSKADEIIKGTYWSNGKGCAVGCTIHSGEHSSYETELGIPRVLARLEDGIFESLPNELAKTWPERFLKAIKPGADLSKVWPKFAVWLLTDPENGVIRFAKTDAAIKSINDVANLYLRSLKETITLAQWRRVRAYAYVAAYAADAAAAAAYAAADAAAAYAADAADAAAAYAADAAAAAAYAADAAAAYAADAADAYAADAAAAAKTKTRVAQSKKLLDLLKAAPLDKTKDE